MKHDEKRAQYRELRAMTLRALMNGDADSAANHIAKMSELNGTHLSPHADSLQISQRLVMQKSTERDAFKPAATPQDLADWFNWVGHELGLEIRFTANDFTEVK